MKKLSIIFLFISTMVFGQNRFIYDYKFIPDSTNRADVKSEMMYLDIDEKGSKYYSQDVFVSDSIMNAEIEKQMMQKSGSFNIQKGGKSGQVSFKVNKTYPDFQVVLIQNIATETYKISEKEKPIWKIHPETDKFGEYNVQKATTNFGGRKWIAWFCEDLPFMDGPYKFYGLPGLVVKIQDETESHTMVLIGNKKIKRIAKTDTDLPKNQNTINILGMNEISVTEEQYKKVWKNYVNDPSKNMREMMMKNSPEHKVVIKMKGTDGREISDPNEVFRQMEARVKENLKKNNNRIEPELYD